MRIAVLTTDNREPFKDYANPQPHFGPAPGALLEGLAQLPEAEIHVVACTQQPVSAPERIAPNTFFHNLHVPRIGWLRTGYQGCIRAVRKKLKEIQPDIVHGQGTERDCAVSAVLSGFPNVLTIHGNMKAMAKFFRSRPGSFHWLAAKLETYALRKTEGVFCNSAYTESLVAPRAKKVWRVPNALRPAFFLPQPLRSDGAPPVLLNVGVISAYKQQSEILAVAQKLRQRGFRFEIQFAGAVDQKSSYGIDFMRRLAEAQSAGYARHLGMIRLRDVVAAMDGASALIHCPAEEAFGLVVAEGLARNLKFFGFRTGGVPDIADGVEDAELLPTGQWKALEDAIARWLDAGCPRPLSAAAVMRQQYHPEIIARRHLEIYREVLGRKNS